MKITITKKGIVEESIVRTPTTEPKVDERADDLSFAKIDKKE